MSQPAEREAALIQCTGELGRGLDVLHRELRAGDVAERKRAALEAARIQYIGEMDRSLSSVEKDLRAGNVAAARETVAMMRLATVAVDGAGR